MAQRPARGMDTRRAALLHVAREQVGFCTVFLRLLVRFQDVCSGTHAVAVYSNTALSHSIASVDLLCQFVFGTFA